LKSVEHWKGRVIVCEAMLFEHSVAQSSPFSYENFTCIFKFMKLLIYQHVKDKSSPAGPNFNLLDSVSKFRT
jgi:hypothetical protein